LGNCEIRIPGTQIGEKPNTIPKFGGRLFFFQQPEERNKLIWYEEHNHMSMYIISYSRWAWCALQHGVAADDAVAVLLHLIEKGPN